MFSNDVALQNVAATVRTYALKSVTDGKSVRSVSGAVLGNPRTLSISHTQVLRGKNAIGQPIYGDRHLVRIDTTTTNGDGISQTGSVYVVIEQPQTIVSKADVQQCIEELVFFLSTASYGNVAKLLNSEP